MRQNRKDNYKQETLNKKLRFSVSSLHFPVKHGQSLVEVVIALGVVVILAVSLVSASLIVQRSARNAKNNTQATKLVQQTIEQLRVLRDRRGFSIIDSNGTYYCIKNTSLTPDNWQLEPVAGNCPVVTLDKINFSPMFTIENGANVKQKKITVTVSWTDSSGTQKVSNVTNLSDCVTSSATC